MPASVVELTQLEIQILMASKMYFDTMGDKHNREFRVVPGGTTGNARVSSNRAAKAGIR
jgi:hypothetical protein